MTNSIVRNIFNCKAPTEGELFDTLLERKNVKIQRIISSEKLPDKVHEQKKDEWVILIKGAGQLENVEVSE